MRTPSDPATLHDNPGTWLDQTDLVFIDPVGTGYSRALVDDKEATRQFSTAPTVTSGTCRVLSRTGWFKDGPHELAQEHLVGEATAASAARASPSARLGVAMNGVVLLSPYLDPAASDDENVSPLPWMLTLPSIAAAHLEREHKLSAEAMP